jgi:hypothetical protein
MMGIIVLLLVLWWLVGLMATLFEGRLPRGRRARRWWRSR